MLHKNLRNIIASLAVIAAAAPSFAAAANMSSPSFQLNGQFTSDGSFSTSSSFQLGGDGPAIGNKSSSASYQLTGNVTIPSLVVDLKVNGSDSTVSISSGASVTLTWTTQNASSCTISSIGSVATSGSQSSGALSSTVTYTFTCAGIGGTGTATDSVSVSVSSSSGGGGGGGGGGGCIAGYPYQPGSACYFPPVVPVPVTPGTGLPIGSGSGGSCSIYFQPPNSVLPRNRSIRDVGADVQVLQKFLNANGYAVAASGAGSSGKETTKFGDGTRNAIRKFQQAAGLPQAEWGTLGTKTREFINAGACQIPVQQPEPPAQPSNQCVPQDKGRLSAASALLTRPLAFNSVGDDVKVLQKFLNQNGFLLASGAQPGAPGYETRLYRNSTRAAEKSFESAFCTGGQDGALDRETIDFINSLFATPVTPEPVQPTACVAPSVDLLAPISFQLTRNLGTGVVGNDVNALQKFLNASGYTVNTGSLPGAPGYETRLFREQTRGAVQRLQEAYCITGETGRTGAKTRELINQKFGGAPVPTPAPAAPTPVVEPPVTQAADTCTFGRFTLGIAQSVGGPAEEIKRVQRFLNRYAAASIAESGKYDAATIAAVKAFQMQNRSSIMDPQGLTEPTGEWFASSRAVANRLQGCK